MKAVNIMDRLTEYHNGVAVIKGKRYKEAAEKLARYEDEEELKQVLAKNIGCNPEEIKRIIK